jgi:hypothetical protein
MSKHTDEIRKFLRVRRPMRMMDPESLISVQIGGPDEAHITASGLGAVLAEHADMLEALEAAVACGMVPVSSAEEGGAAKFSEQVRVADTIRNAIKKARGQS